MNPTQRSVLRGAAIILVALLLVPPSYDASPDGKRRISKTELRPATNLIASTDPVLVDFLVLVKELAMLILGTSLCVFATRNRKGE